MERGTGPAEAVEAEVEVAVEVAEAEAEAAAAEVAAEAAAEVVAAEAAAAVAAAEAAAEAEGHRWCRSGGRPDPGTPASIPHVVPRGAPGRAAVAKPPPGFCQAASAFDCTVRSVQPHWPPDAEVHVRLDGDPVVARPSVTADGIGIVSDPALSTGGEVRPRRNLAARVGRSRLSRSSR